MGNHCNSESYICNVFSNLTNFGPQEETTLLEHLLSNENKTKQKLMNLNPKAGEYKYYKRLGKGGFAKVYLVKNKENFKFYSVKVIKKHIISLKKLHKYALNERRILTTSSFPFIVKLERAFQDDYYLYFVMEYMAGGTLTKYIKKKGKLNEEKLKFIAAEVLLSLKYLHDKAVLFRDLKPENVMFDSDGHIKLIDFGLCKILKGSQAHSFLGTPLYFAPEVLKGFLFCYVEIGYDCKADIWAFGCLLYELSTGVPPFDSNDRASLYNHILTQEPIFPKSFSNVLKDLLTGLLNKNWKQRYSIEEIQRHDFFKGMDFDKLLRKEVPSPFGNTGDKDCTPERVRKSSLIAQGRRNKNLDGFDFEVTGERVSFMN